MLIENSTRNIQIFLSLDMNSIDNSSTNPILQTTAPGHIQISILLFTHRIEMAAAEETAQFRSQRLMMWVLIRLSNVTIVG
jgi:hypothetical protein